jgi:two-component system LytT family response regulator
MNILLLEDEPLVAESLRKHVLSLEPGAVLQGPIATVKEAREILSVSLPDLIISDIQLADGVSLDLFTEQKINCPVIFTTAYNEYAIRAFKINSIDYLLKPIDKNELKTAFDKFHSLKAQFGNEPYLQHLNELLTGFKKSPKYKERFTVHSGRNIVLVNTDDIAYFSKEELIYLHHKDEKKYITDFRSLDEVAELLDPDKFHRANRQYLVQLSCISSMRSDETGKIIVKLSVKSPDIIVSKEKAATFRKWVEG